MSDYDREIRLDTQVALPIAEAWAAWTREGVITKFFGSEAHIEPQVGGAYEILFLMENSEGMRGSEGCTILAYEAPRRLAFTWNAPPHLETRQQYTVVELRFSETETGGTGLELVHRGFGVGEQWDATFQYFQKAWGMVLQRFEEWVRERQ